MTSTTRPTTCEHNDQRRCAACRAFDMARRAAADKTEYDARRADFEMIRRHR